MNALLELSGVTKRFGGLTALEDVSLTVAQGTIHAVIGPNGSGKTTLFNIISGIYTPTGGEVRFESAVVTSKPLHQLAAMGLARTFQNTRLFGSMTVRQNVLAARHGRAHPWRFDQENARRVDEIIAFVGLADVADANAASLPQGQRRLLEIAKALALEPRLVLLDEPHGGLNHAETARLIEVIRQMHARGMTILLIEHEMEVVMTLADRITVLNFGKVLAEERRPRSSATTPSSRPISAVPTARRSSMNRSAARAKAPARRCLRSPISWSATVTSRRSGRCR